MHQIPRVKKYQVLFGVARVQFEIADDQLLDYLNACKRLWTERDEVELLVEL